LTALVSWARLESMAVPKRFWSGGRRRFVARLLSTGGLLLVGGLVTSEVLEKLSPVLKWVLGVAAAVALIGAVVIWSDDDPNTED